MNSRHDSSPLTLLMGGGVSEIEARLRSFLVAGPEISLSHVGSGNSRILEVVYHGVSLRLAINPNVSGQAALKKIFCNPDAASIGCGVEIGLSDHVAGGERVPAVIQALLGAAREVGISLGASGAIWHPASIVSGFDYFSEAVADYLAGGAFPVLAMVNFRAEDDGTINSTGLSLLSRTRTADFSR